MVLIAVGHWLVAFGSFNGWKPRFDEKPYVDWKLIFPFGLNYAYVPDRTSNQKENVKTNHFTNRHLRALCLTLLEL